MKRRDFLPTLAGGAVLVAGAGASLAAENAKRKRLGIGMHSYGAHWSMARNSPPPPFTDAASFLAYAHELGAGGVQVSLGACEVEVARHIRKQAEEWGMFFEAQAALPKDEADVERFTAEVKSASEAGVKVMRAALLSGRRYESFSSAQEFKKFEDAAWASAALGERVVRRWRIRLAIENHKDWLAGQLAGHLRWLGSEWVGATLDFGNNISLMEDPYEVVETLAPLAFSTHIKDVAMEESPEGFLMSEVPLGDGMLDLKRMMAACEQANPDIHYNLEMITRNPLVVPCLRPGYWATFEAGRASALARTLGLVKQNKPRQPLPNMAGKSDQQRLAFEDENVRRSLAYATAKLGLA